MIFSSDYKSQRGETSRFLNNLSNQSFFDLPNQQSQTSRVLIKQKIGQQINNIIDSVYKEENFENTIDNLFNISEQPSEEETRIGEKAYESFYKRYKKSYHYPKLEQKPIKRQLGRYLSVEKLKSHSRLSMSNGFNNLRRDSDMSINAFPCTSRNERARKQYLKIIEKEKLPPLPLGVIEKKGQDKYVNLNSQNLSVQYSRAIGQSLKILGSEKVNLVANQLRHNQLEELIKGLTRAKDINLKDNDIGIIGVKLLVQNILSSYESRLEFLNLENNQLGDQATMILLEHCQNGLVKLNLGKNKISNASITSICKVLERSTTLRELVLHWNKLTGSILPLLTRSLAVNKKLKVLDLSWNALGQTANQTPIGETLGLYLSSNTSLIHLDISFNNINREQTLILSSHLKLNHTLLGLHYQGNEGEVDSCGFLVEKTQIPNNEHIKSEVTNNLPYYERIKSRSQKYREKSNINKKKSDNCWICNKWVETQITWDQQDEEILDVFLHFEFEDFKPSQMGLSSHNEKLHVLWKMLPQGTHHYYFTVNGIPQINEKHLRSDQCYSIPSLTKLNTLQAIKHSEVIDNYYRSQLKVCFPRPLAVEIVEDIEIIEEIRVKTPWTLENSIFKDYRCDNEDIIRECFEFDWSCMRKPKFASDQEETDIKAELYKGYNIIKNLYRPYSALGMIGGIYAISLNTYTDIMKEVLNLVDGDKLKLNDIDMMFIVVNAIRKGDYNPPNGLVRYQFLEILLRIAFKKYYIAGIVQSQSLAINMLIETNLKGIASNMNYQSNQWRHQRYWNEGCDNTLKAFKDLLEFIYNSYGGTHKKPGEKTFMTFDEFERFINDSKLCNDLLFQRDICVCFNLAMMTQINEITKNRHLRATYIEFLEAIARAVDKASQVEVNEGYDSGGEDKSLSEERIKERINKPLQLKLIQFMDKVLTNCVPKAFKEKYEYPVIEDKEKMMFYIKQ